MRITGECYAERKPLYRGGKNQISEFRIEIVELSAGIFSARSDRRRFRFCALDTWRNGTAWATLLPPICESHGHILGGAKPAREVCLASERAWRDFHRGH